MNLLITKNLPPATLDLIKSWGWNYEVVAALEISLLNVARIPQADGWVISSRNSWPVVQQFIAEAPPNIYCVGSWLGDKLEKSEVKSSVQGFENMQSLAAELGKGNKRQWLYFCADNHRGELEKVLQGTDFTITKVITHESKVTYPRLSKTYDAILLFSPRSAESILKNNSFNPQTIFVCIGSTTESYLHQLGMANTFCASVPSHEILLQEFHAWVQTPKL